MTAAQGKSRQEACLSARCAGSAGVSPAVFGILPKTLLKRKGACSAVETRHALFNPLPQRITARPNPVLQARLAAIRLLIRLRR
jgi:hypothetical protein